MENLDICPPWCDNNEVKKYRYGLVAQLGAHHIRIVGVVGSNPIRSTRNKASVCVACLVFVSKVRSVFAPSFHLQDYIFDEKDCHSLCIWDGSPFFLHFAYARSYFQSGASVSAVHVS